MFLDWLIIQSKKPTWRVQLYSATGEMVSLEGALTRDTYTEEVVYFLLFSLRKGSILCFGFVSSGFFAISKTGFAFTLVDRLMQCFSSFLNEDICFVSRLSVRDLNVVPLLLSYFFNGNCIFGVKTQRNTH